MSTSTRSRRSVLTGGLAVLGGAAAATLAGPAAVAAANGDPVKLGGDGTANAASAATVVANSADKGVALEGDANSNGTGVVGRAGKESGTPRNISDVGVFGFASDGSGVFGVGPTGVEADGHVGVYATGRYAVVGDGGTEETGVIGWSGEATAPPGPAGVGVYAAAETALVALSVNGRAQFSRSGRVTIPSGTTKVVSVPGVTAASYVIATLQTNRPGVWIQAVAPGAGKFTIYLNKAVTGATVVGYLVIN
jgi:hypothetical protein